MLAKKCLKSIGRSKANSQNEKQAGAELGQAQPQLGLGLANVEV